MNGRQLVRTSKLLSRHLRHQPESLGLTLEPGGWVPVEALLRACARKGMRLTHAELDEVVTHNDKQRFSFDETGTRIRANQGHSVPIDLQLQPAEPPPILYHGTGRQTLPAIFSQGLLPMRRHHVHLSVDVATARRVGARHGKPAVLTVDAARLRAAGHPFYVASNGVWLVDRVPAEFLGQVPWEAERT